MDKLDKTLSLSIFHLATVADRNQIKSLSSKERQAISQIANSILSDQEPPSINTKMCKSIKEKLSGKEEVEWEKDFIGEKSEPKDLLAKTTHLANKVLHFFKHLVGFRPSSGEIMNDIRNAKDKIQENPEHSIDSLNSWVEKKKKVFASPDTLPKSQTLNDQKEVDSFMDELSENVELAARKADIDRVSDILTEVKRREGEVPKRAVYQQGEEIKESDVKLKFRKPDELDQ